MSGNKFRCKFGLIVSLALTFLGATSQACAQYVGQISSIVTDINGNIISQQNPDLQRYPASLTKMMTLYMTFRALQANAITLDQRIPVSVHSATMEPSKLGLRPGSMITVREAILGLVTKSANDAACTLGEFLGGGNEGRFAQMMTQEAHILGMSRTYFRNASGLPNPGQVTTARDLATLARHLVIDYPEYYTFFSVPSFNFRGRIIPSHDPLLKSYPGADGLKTGYTAAAGHNLTSSAVRGNVRLIGVVLGSRSNAQRNTLMTSLLDEGFSSRGIAPVARPILLARNTVRHARRRGHSAFVLARASRSLRNGTMQVAEAPVKTGGKRLHIRGSKKSIVSKVLNKRNNKSIKKLTINNRMVVKKVNVRETGLSNKIHLIRNSKLINAQKKKHRGKS